MNLRHMIACGAAVGALVIACVTFYCLGLGLVPVYIVGGPGLLAVFFGTERISSARPIPQSSCRYFCLPRPDSRFTW